MPASLRTWRPARRRHALVRPHLETLEARTLLSGPGSLTPPPAETLDQARPLLPGQEAVGALGNGPAGAADVDWFRFHLDRAADVTLATRDQAEGRSLVSVLSLYNTTDPYDPVNQVGDPYEVLGHRLLTQAAGSAGSPDAALERQLGPGDYYVAVSGAGNRYFHPFIAGSGYPGAAGDFALLLTTQDLTYSGSTPAVLTMDPAADASLDHSPFEVRLDLSANWNTGPSNYANVQLVYSASGTFGADTTPVAVNYNYSPGQLPNTTEEPELQLLPLAALKPGFYRVLLGSPGNPVLANPNGLSLTFQVTASEGNPSGLADDTTANAHDLGDVTASGIVHVAGAIGEDYIDDSTPFDVNDVDMYHFRVSGPGIYQITAEVFAGRIGSPLNAAVSLFRLGSDNLLHLVAANADSHNTTAPVVGTGQPLFGDPALFGGLTAGDYYLAVSSGLNVPDPVLGLQPGSNGVFDPNTTHSGQNGDTTGPYVLNFLVQPSPNAPQVISVSRDDGTHAGGSPVRFTVQFSEPVNVQQLAFQVDQQTSQIYQAQLPAAFVAVPGNPGATPHPLRLESYDLATYRATFVMLDGLPSGSYELHLSGANGLTDLAGNPLVGNTGPGGDYVYPFTVYDPVRDTGFPLVVYKDVAGDAVQNIGPLFANELLAQSGGSPVGVTVRRDYSAQPWPLTAVNTQDVYQVQLLYPQFYAFTLVDRSNGLLAGATVTLSTDPNGLNSVDVGTGFVLRNPGIYYLHVGPLPAADPRALKYDLFITITGNLENPTPLTVGAAPAIRFRVATNTPPPPGPTPQPGGTPPPVPLPPGPLNLPPPVTPVVLSNSPGPDAVPSAILLALGFGPLGGPANAADSRVSSPGLDVLNRVVTQAPRLLSSDEVVQVVSLLRTLDYGEDEAPAGAPKTPATASGLSWPEFRWSQTLDLLFRFWNGLSRHPVTAPEPDSFPEDEPEIREGGTEGEFSFAAPGAAALALGGAFLGAGPAGREERKPGERARRITAKAGPVPVTP